MIKGPNGGGRRALPPTLPRIIGLLAPHPLRAALGLVLGLVSATALVLQPLVLGRIVDGALLADSRSALHGGAIALGLLALARFACGAVRHVVGESVSLSVRDALWLRLAGHVLAGTAERPGPADDRRPDVAADMAAVHTFLGALLLSTGMATLLLSAVAMWLLSPGLTLLVGAFLLPALAVAGYSGARVGAAERRRRDRLADLADVTREHTEGFEAVRTTGSSWLRRTFVERADQLHTDIAAVGRLRAGLEPGVLVLPGLAGAGLLWAGGSAVRLGELTLGGLVALGAYLMILAAVVATVGPLVGSAETAAVCARRVFAALDSGGPRSERLDAIDLRRSDVGLAVEIRDLSAGSLRGLWIQIQPGERVTVVGGSASERALLTALLTGERHPETGSILLDGVNNARLALRSLRREVLSLDRDPFLCAATVRENLHLGPVDDAPTDAELRRVLRPLRLLDLVDGLPGALDNPLETLRHKLSAGQRQRLALARAILHRPRLLLLDGALSAVDPLTELTIRQQLPTLLGETTIVFLDADRSRGAVDRVVPLELIQWSGPDAAARTTVATGADRDQ